MKVSGQVSIHLKLKGYPYPNEVYEQIRAEIGEKSPARMLSEYLFRLLSQMDLPGTIVQVSALPEEWIED
jgi:hypothetical protein